MNTSINVDHGGIDEVKIPLVPRATHLDMSREDVTTHHQSTYIPVTKQALVEQAEAQKLILALGLTTELAQAVVPVLIRNLITLESKQKDYGPHNLIKFGEYGVVVRMGDKMERIINLSKKQRQAYGNTTEMYACNEPMADSFLDMANYSLIGYVMQTGVWPK